MKGFCIFLATVTFVGCSSILSQQAIDRNIRVVTHPQSVAGMRFVDGYISSAGTIWGHESIGNMAANDAAKKGWSDIVILVELVYPGELPGVGAFEIGRQAAWRISFYRW